jgi:flagellar hook-associated protein 1 FlgK
MALTSAFSNALSGLTATSRMVETVSNNIANARTAGYAVRQVETSVRAPFGGVRIDSITRLVDQGIVQDRRSAETRMAGDDRTFQAIQRLEQALGAIDSPDTIGGRIVALEQSLISAASDPASDLRLSAVLDRLNGVAAAFQDADGTIRLLRQEADGSIKAQVDQLNSALTRVDELNRAIVKARPGGTESAALQDQRQREIDRIAEIVPIRELVRDNGAVALVTPSGAVLLDGRAAEIGFQTTPTIVAEMSLGTGALSGLTLNGQPVLPADGIGKLGGGALGASFALRDSILPSIQSRIDSLAANMIERFQDASIDPTLGPGSPGLFTDAGAAFDPANEIGVAGRISVAASVDPARGGELFRLRDGTAAITPGPVGDSTRLNAWMDALNRPMALSLGGIANSAGELANAASASLSEMRLRAEEQFGFSATRWSALKSAELERGVDTDQEMQNLLRLEQSYAANARVIQTLDSLIRRLMEI